jgi:glucans biosynthesis protein
VTTGVWRRDALRGGLGLAALPFLGRLGRALAAAPRLELGAPEPFDFERLTARAQALAAAPYHAPEVRLPDLLERIDYDAYRDIRFRRDHAIWQDGPGNVPVHLFHLGRFFKEPVHIHLVAEGGAREVLYDPALFGFGPQATFVRGLPADMGFAGFRLMASDNATEWVAFLGASYFRSPGEERQYGLSARGLAIDTGMPYPEEFPRFSAFWLEPVPGAGEAMIIHALLESPSVAGAYRIDARHTGPVVMDFEARLFARTDVARLGIAPLTSMFWYSETNRHMATDWRPEIHDSDGLAIWTGHGERLWRPLNDPVGIARTSSFLDRSPKGFGLVQRDRDFANYEDTGAHYERRPSAWVEPLEDWGQGAVQLLEIPTDDETEDNIVAWWTPAEPVTAGVRRDFRYRLHWRSVEPHPSEEARVVATRLSRGGYPGQARPRGMKKFVVDFAGGRLDGLPADIDHLPPEDRVTPVVTASAGVLSGAHALPVEGTPRWRAVFDLTVEGTEPVELRLFLRLRDQTLSETWLYQYVPFEFAGESQ